MLYGCELSQTFLDLKSDIRHSNSQVFKTSYNFHGKLLLILSAVRVVTVIFCYHVLEYDPIKH